MKLRIGFAVLVGVVYLLVGLRASFGITSIDFWSGMVGFFGTIAVLPLAIFSIWKIRLAGWLLLADAAMIACSCMLQARDRDEVSGGIALAVPLVFSGMLLLKRVDASSSPDHPDKEVLPER